jgi:hypothetical protein
MMHDEGDDSVSTLSNKKMQALYMTIEDLCSVDARNQPNFETDAWTTWHPGCPNPRVQVWILRNDTPEEVQNMVIEQSNTFEPPASMTPGEAAPDMFQEMADEEGVIMGM